MDYNLRDEKLFMLRMFQFIYQINGEKLPNDLQIELSRFSSEEASYFTDSVAKAVFIILEEWCLTNKDANAFDRNARDISINDNPFEFLRFFSLFGMSAITDSDEDTSRSYQKVWLVIETMFRREKDMGRLNSETWDRLDEEASLIVDDDRMECRLLTIYDPEKNLNLEDEEAFVLRLMQHIFGANFRHLPEYFTDRLHRVDQKNYHLTENVRNALLCLLEVQRYKSKMVKDSRFMNLYRCSMEVFRVYEYLEFCVCFSKKAFDDYYFKKKTFTPFKVHECCVRLLQDLRERGLPVPWQEIEETADTITRNYDCVFNDQEFINVCDCDRLRNLFYFEPRECLPVIRASTEIEIAVQAARRLGHRLSLRACDCYMCYDLLFTEEN